MSYLSYRGLLDVELFHGEHRTALAGLNGLFEQRMVWTYALLVEGDHGAATHVRVRLPAGEVIAGHVTYSKPGTLIFSTHNEFGDAVRMPDDA
jgi:hypothetical protein